MLYCLFFLLLFFPQDVEKEPASEPTENENVEWSGLEQQQIESGTGQLDIEQNRTLDPTLPSPMSLMIPLYPPANEEAAMVSAEAPPPFTGRGFWGNVVGTKEPNTLDDAPDYIDAKQLKDTILLLSGHVGPVEAVAFSPDCNTILSGGSDRQMLLWNAMNGEQLRRYRGSRSSITSLCVSSNGENFVSCTPTDRRVLFWQFDSETPAEEFPTTQFEPSSVVMDARAQTIVVGLMDGQITIYNKLLDFPKPRETTFKAHLLAVNRVRFSPDERFFLSCGNDRAVSIWDAQTAKLVRTFRFHKGAVLCADYSPDGQWIVSAGTDKTAILWNVADGEVKHRLSGHVGDITDVAFSTDGSRIMTASKDRMIFLWDAETGERIAMAPKRNSPILSAAWSHVNDSVAIGCVNGTVEILASSVFISEKEGTGEKTAEPHVASPSRQKFSDDVLQKREKLLKLPQGRMSLRYGRTSSYNDLGSVSPNGFQFASITSDRGDGTLWEADTGKVTRILRGSFVVSAIRFHSKDSNFLITGSKNGAIQYWNLTLDNVINSFPGHESPIQTLAVSSDGTRFLSGAADGTVILWNLLEKRKLATVQASKKKIRSLSLSPDGKHFAVGSEDNLVGLWTIGAGTAGTDEEYSLAEQKLTGHEKGNISVVFSPDGTRLYSAAADGIAIQWDVTNSGKLLQEYTAHTDSIESIAISPNGQYLLTGGKSEEFSLLWDVNVAQPIMVLPFQGGPVTDVMFHPKSFSVITIGGRTPVLWNIAEIQNLAR